MSSSIGIKVSFPGSLPNSAFLSAMAADVRREFPLLRGPSAMSPIGPDALAAFERTASDRSARLRSRFLSMMIPDRAGSS